MKVVHAIARLNVGGAALQVLELAAGQRRRGHDVLVLHGRLADGEESMTYLAEELDVPSRYLPELQRELSPWHDGKAVRRVRSVLRAERPDVLHTHAAKAGATGRIAAVLAGGARPHALVHTFHGHVLRGYFEPRRERAFRLAERLLARRTSALVAVSAEVRDDLVALGVAPTERFEVIPYGFDLEGLVDADAEGRRRGRERLGLQDGTFVVGFAGRLAPVKRPLDLVRALKGLVMREVDAVLVLVGDGPERPRAEALARELDVGDRCRFVGYQRSLREWYAAFDALCLTSANEGTPVAAIEALAAGRPVVATAVGGVPAVVDDGETGYLVRPGDHDAVSERLAELARDPALRERLGRAGAARMRERYAIERMVDDVERLYGRLLARR